MTKKNREIDPARALRHPLRRAIVCCMLDAPVLSPRELSKGLGESLARVSYHVRVLKEAGGGHVDVGETGTGRNAALLFPDPRVHPAVVDSGGASSGDFRMSSSHSRKPRATSRCSRQQTDIALGGAVDSESPDAAAMRRIEEEIAETPRGQGLQRRLKARLLEDRLVLEMLAAKDRGQQDST